MGRGGGGGGVCKEIGGTHYAIQNPESEGSLIDSFLRADRSDCN